MFRSRLAIKIGLLIVIVLILGFGASTIVTIRRESDALIDQNKIAARRLTTAVSRPSRAPCCRSVRTSRAR